MRAKHALGFTVALLLVAAYVSRGRADEIAKPTVNLSVYGHVSSVVWVAKDLEPVLNYWEKLGLKDIDRSNVTESTGLVYRGKPAPTTARCAFGRVGDVVIQWIQPVTGNNLYTEFLKRHGDGILALGYVVKSDRELEGQTQYLQSKGVQIVQRTQWKNANGIGRGAYLDTAAKGGGITILLYHDLNGPAPAGSKIRANDAPFTKFDHYAFVVRNDRKVGDYWQDLGFGAMKIDHNISVDRFYRGQPGIYEMDLGWQYFADTPFEWIQSTKGPNVYEEYLREHGEGLHHMGVDVEDMDAAAKAIAAKGASRIMWGGWDTPDGKGRFAYLDTGRHGGVTLELIWDQPKPK
jgi:4-hydroxyphenylpyruvate dioxygenase-like putative hemolysin